MSGALTIRSVADGVIVVGADTYESTIALTPDTVHDDWPEKAVSELVESDFTHLLESQPEVLIMGTGSANVFPPRELVFALARKGVGFEVMDTAAAARTFNILAGEGRRVAAVLYLGSR
jgi:uncharacterized protein